MGGADGAGICCITCRAGRASGCTKGKSETTTIHARTPQIHARTLGCLHAGVIRRFICAAVGVSDGHGATARACSERASASPGASLLKIEDSLFPPQPMLHVFVELGNRMDRDGTMGGKQASHAQNGVNIQCVASRAMLWS